MDLANGMLIIRNMHSAGKIDDCLRNVLKDLLFDDDENLVELMKQFQNSSNQELIEDEIILYASSCDLSPITTIPQDEEPLDDSLNLSFSTIYGNEPKAEDQIETNRDSDKSTTSSINN